MLVLALPAAASHDEAPGARVDRALEALAAGAGVPEAQVPRVACGTLDAAVAAFAAQLGVPAPEASGVDAPALAGLVCALHAAQIARDAAYAGIDAGELARAISSEAPDINVGIEHVAANAAGARHVARAVDAALPALAAAPPLVLDLWPVLAFDGIGADSLYARDYALVVDVGGDDVYANNAGGSLIAFGDGGFLPIRGDPESFGQEIPTPTGARAIVGGDFEDAELVFSASLLLDLEGDDTYGVPRAPWHDARCTSEPVVRKVVIQGAGAGGPGLLFDLGGANTFTAKTIAQGTGHVGGVGVLSLGDGPDHLQAVRLAQGSGLFFGLGLLVDEGGDDVYEAKVPAGGVFNTDGSFCDDEPRYLHGTGFARVTGGASGVAGALLDLGGDDRYVGGAKTTGFAEVASIGVLYDASGDDSYRSTTRAMGYASGHPSTSGGGLALFLDAAGNDRYALADADGLGATAGALADPTEPPPPRDPVTFWVNDLIVAFVDPALVAGSAAFYDGGGADAYETPAARANGEAKATSMGGVFIDAS